MNKKFLIDKSLDLVIPSTKDKDQFLEQVKKSQELHSPWVSPPANEKQFNEYINNTHKENQCGFLLKYNGKIIGAININEIVRGCFQSAYLVFHLFNGYQRKGRMSAGLNKAVQYAFSELGLHRLEANIQPNNKPSISLIKRAGFRHEGFSINYLFINNAWQDHERVALL